jgi:viologen exporter family transport system permease protein
MRRELRFLAALWRANLQAAMEYRAAFLTQVAGMVINNGLYFLFWVLFFDRFEQVGGYGLREVALLFGVAACSFGLGVYLFGNVISLAEIISEGRLDYYLALPRPALLHTLASRSVASGLGDASYGLISFLAVGPHTADGLARFVVAVLCGAAVFVGFLILVNSLAFWMGGASQISSQALMALLTFATYPISLFDGTAKLLLFTVLPAALMGAVPAEFVRGFGWAELSLMACGAASFLGLAVLAFQRGLRHYESGSAITTQS